VTVAMVGWLEVVTLMNDDDDDDDDDGVGLVKVLVW